MAKNATPLLSVIQAAAAIVENSDFGKAMTVGIDRFSEGMPVILNALDELERLHAVLGGEFTT
jgi:hypothetical protein